MRPHDVAVEPVDDRPRASSWSPTSAAIVDFPAADSPVNQTTKPSRSHHMETTFGPPRARPAALPPRARERRVGVADRGVAAIVEGVVRQAALADVRPAGVIGPVGHRVRLPELVSIVPAELRGVRTRRCLVTADTGDPAVEVHERAVQRLDLGDRQVEVGFRLPDELAMVAASSSGRGPSNTSTFRLYRCSTSAHSSYVSGKR